MFFGFELILREFSIDALFAIILSAVTADVVSRAFFGSAPFFTQIPHDLVLAHDDNYLLVAAPRAGRRARRRRVQDRPVQDRGPLRRALEGPPGVGPARRSAVWPSGAVLLALPQIYGVGYPVMDKAIAGHVVLWFLVVLMVGKMRRRQPHHRHRRLGRGVRPVAVHRGHGRHGLRGHRPPPLRARVGSPAIYGVVAMGAVFAAAAQAPLTAIASVVEMTGNFTLTLPVMLAVGIAAGVSKRLTYGTIYTTKLLRRGTDIERPRPAARSRSSPWPTSCNPSPTPRHPDRRPSTHHGPDGPVGTLDPTTEWPPLGRLSTFVFPRSCRARPSRSPTPTRPLRSRRPPRAFRGRPPGIGWITSHDVIHAMADRVGHLPPADAAQANAAAEWAKDEPSASLKNPPDPLPGHEIAEIAITDSSRLAGPAAGR